MCALALVSLGADARLTENTPLEKIAPLNITCAPVRTAQAVDAPEEIAYGYDQCVSEIVQYLFNELAHQTSPYQRGEPHGSGMGKGTHWYDVENYACSVSDSGCTTAAVDKLIKQYPAPTACVVMPGCTPTPVSTGDQSFAWPVGSVTHTVSSSLVVNQTQPTHLLHDGMVMRSSVERDGAIYVRSLGFGNGRFPGPNVSNAAALWGAVDRRIRNRFP